MSATTCFLMKLKGISPFQGTFKIYKQKDNE